MFYLTIVACVFTQKFPTEFSEFDSRKKISNVPGSTYKNVLVVYNKNYQLDENDNGIQDSYEIALYYKAKRGLSDKQVLGIHTSTSEEIVYDSYDAYYDQTNSTLNIRQEIENYLDYNHDEQGHSLKYKVRFIALCKGIPLKIKFMSSTAHNLADYASVDASLSLMFNDNYSKKWGLKNSYYQKDPYGMQLSNHGGFKGFQNPLVDENGNSYTLNYLVSRLDAYHVNDVKAMIDRSLNAAKSTVNGDFIIDDHPGKNYDQMPTTASWLKYPSLGYSVSYNDNSSFIYDNVNPVIFYTSHGKHAGMPDGYINNFNFQFADGAAFTTYESFNGFGFKNPSQSSHGQIAEWIAKGGTVGIGNVYEPWSSNIAKELHLSFVYAAGYHWIEAAYQSLTNLDFVATIVGDPLTQIKNVNFVDDGSFNNLEVMNTFPKTGSTNNSLRSTIMFEFNKKLKKNQSPNVDSEKFDLLIKGNKLFLTPKSDLNSSVSVTVSNIIADDNTIIVSSTVSFSTSSSENSKVKLLFSSIYSDSIANMKDTAEFIFSKYENPVIESNENTNLINNWISNNVLQTELNSNAGDEYLLKLLSNQLSFVYKFPVKITENANYESIVYDFDKDSREERLEERDLDTSNGFENYIDNDTNVSFLKFNISAFKNFIQIILVEASNGNVYLYGITEEKTIYEYAVNKKIISNRNIYTFDYNQDGIDDRLIDNEFTDQIDFIPFDTISNNFKDSESISLNKKLQINFSQVIPENIAKEQIRFFPNLDFSIKRSQLNQIEIQANTSFLPNTKYMMYIYDRFSDSYEQSLDKSLQFTFKTITMSEQKRPVLTERKIDGNKAIINWVGNASDIEIYKSSSIYFNTNSSTAYRTVSTNKFEDTISDSIQVYKLHNKIDSEFSEEIYIKKEQHIGLENLLNRYQLELPGFSGTVSKLAEFIPNLKSVSIWNNSSQSWQEATLLENLNIWANDFFIDFGTPIQVIAEGHINTFVISGVKDTIVYNVEASINNYKDHSFVHLGEEVYFSDLFKNNKDIIAAAIWDNTTQKWSESSYLSLFDKWINDQKIKKGQSYYLKSKADIKITYVLGNVAIEDLGRRKSNAEFNLIADGKRSHNSLNLILESQNGINIRVTDLETDESSEFIKTNQSLTNYNIGNFANGWYIGKKYKIEYEIHGEIFETKTIELDGEIVRYNFNGPLPSPKEFILEQNYPNPFNPETTIAFQVIPNQDFFLTVYNILGQKVKQFQFSTKNQNHYKVKWNGTNEIGKKVSSGIYFYELRSDSFVDRKKMILIK